MQSQLTAGELGVEVTGLRKRYGNTQALDNLDIALRAGKITGIAGPNGAGKSTLVRILAGETAPDAGMLKLDGTPWSPSQSKSTVAVVHQEPQLFPNLTVSQNLLVGREETRFAWPTTAAPQDALLRQLELWEYRRRPLGACSLAVQQRTEIARAVGANARLFLFDEPNSALSAEESEDLFRFLRRLARDGCVVVLVSHRLAELVANCDTVSIIRDGRVTRELSGSEMSADRIAQQLVAGHLGGGAAFAPKNADPVKAAPVLQLIGWSHRENAFRDIDLTISPGEVTALIGVEGSGARELVRSVAALERAKGQSVSTKGPRTSSVTVEYVGPDRREALFYNLSLAENVASRLSDSRVANPWGTIKRSGVRSVGESWVERFQIRSESVDQPIGALSGGNQQKVALAAAIARDPELLVLEEPTRGVDVASKRDIHQQLADFASRGHGVLIYCTEIVEVYEAADQLYVVSHGRVAAQLSVRDFGDIEALASRISALESKTEPDRSNPVRDQVQQT